MGVKLSALLEANQLVVTSLILPGMSLVVPAGGVVPAPKAAATIPATTPVVVPPAATTPAGTYTVRPGDSLSVIAGRMSVKLAALLAANTLTVTSVIHPGAQLQVPAGGIVPAAVPVVAPVAAPVVAAPIASLQYVVKSGDYLSGIAPLLGVRLADLLSTNNLMLTSLIYRTMSRAKVVMALKKA